MKMLKFLLPITLACALAACQSEQEKREAAAFVVTLEQIAQASVAVKSEFENTTEIGQFTRLMQRIQGTKQEDVFIDSASAILLDSGMILTARHAVYKVSETEEILPWNPRRFARKVSVKMKGQSFVDAEVIAVSTSADLALLRPAKPLTGGIPLAATDLTIPRGQDVSLVGAVAGRSGSLLKMTYNETISTSKNAGFIALTGPEVKPGWSGSAVILQREGKATVIGMLHLQSADGTGGTAHDLKTIRTFVNENLPRAKEANRGRTYTVTLNSVTLTKDGEKNAKDETSRGWLGKLTDKLDSFRAIVKVYRNGRPVVTKQGDGKEMSFPLGPKAAFDQLVRFESADLRVDWTPGDEIRIELWDKDLAEHDNIGFKEFRVRPKDAHFPLNGAVELKCFTSLESENHTGTCGTISFTSR